MSELRTVPIEILLVEDSEADVVLTQETLKDAKVLNNLSVARDGEQAMAALRGEGEHAQEPRPDLILLDLNLPRMDGREVLSELKDDKQLRRIPVIVLTTSTDERDIRGSYDQYVNAYITKPVDLRQFVRAIRSIEEFWLTVAELPPR